MRFGIIGAGCIGELRAKAIARLSGAKLVAVCDLNAANAQRVAGLTGAKSMTDLDALLGMAEIDAVIVCTPPQFHERTVLAAFAAGKQVLCEKPLANSLEACTRMLAAARSSNRTLTTGFNHRYFPAIKFLKETVASGRIGKLNHVRAFAGHEGLSQFRSPSEYDPKVIGGGALLDVGIHLIDLTAFVLGDVREVFGLATGDIWNLPGAEDNGFALLRSRDGRVATLHATWAEWKGYRFHLEAYGDKGMVRAYYAPMMTTVITMDRPGGARKTSRCFYPAIALREKLRGWQSTVIETFREELTDFIALCGGKAGGSIADGYAGFRAIEIANAVYQSGREKRAVSLRTQETL